MKRFTQEDFANYTGKYLHGRIKNFSKSRGHGYIRTELDNDIFLSSYNLENHHIEDKLTTGVVVEFMPIFSHGRYSADKLSIIDDSSRNNVFLIGNIKIEAKYINDYGYVPGNKALKRVGINENELNKNGYTIEDLDYLYISTPNKEYRFFKLSSPVVGDGRVNGLRDIYEEMDEKLMKI